MTEDREAENGKIVSKRNDLRLPRFFSDGMVLQRSARTRIWGWYSAAEKVEVVLRDGSEILASGSGETEENGYWEIFLELSMTGTGYILEVKADGCGMVRVSDVAVGEVWLCSGQSNMELPIRRIRDRFPEEVADCEDGDLRIFKIMEHYDFREPLEDTLSGEWKKSQEENVPDFSGLTWFYGRFLRETQKVPVGLINVSLGGTPVEAWIGKEALVGEAELQETIRLYASEGFIEQKLKRDEEAGRAWMSRCRETDRGLAEKWYLRESREEHAQAEEGGAGDRKTERLSESDRTQVSQTEPGRTEGRNRETDCGEEESREKKKTGGIEDQEWKKITLPGWLSERGLRDFIGVIWLRKRFTVPKEMIGKAAKIWLGTMTDSDETYINGTMVGWTGYQYPPRKYEVPEGVLQAEENEVVIRLTCNNGNGRMTPDKPCRIFTEHQHVELAGEWEYRIGTVMEEPAPESDFVSWKPTGLYNGMIAPCRRYTVKGFVWYQGESNDKTLETYEKRLKTLISDWRHQWGQGEIPFLVAQLPGFAIDLPVDSGWPELREAQRRAMELPNTAVTVNLDLGEWNDLHPLNKKDVAYRLSLAARALAYGENVVWQGPVAVSCRAEESGVRITFSETGTELLTADGRPATEFEAAGEDGKYYPVEARIEGNTVLLTDRYSREMKKIRYAWRNWPDRGLLCNGAGLLASPFEMDSTPEKFSIFYENGGQG